jgi:NADPH2:quinone reductase
MRAVWLREFGGPEVLRVEETPAPEPGPGQVLIDVSYANITFVETQIRAGTGPFTPALPTIMGNGVGGVVADVGDGVDETLTGRQVITSTGGSGGYAEQVATDAAGLYDVPPGLDLDAAVALLADGRTAVMLIRTAGIAEGDRVLVEAAAGGVGTLLVQLARAAGATVVAAAGGDRKVEIVRGLGADHVVDYRRPEWAEQVRAAVGGVDVVLDGVGGTIGRAAFDLLGPGGRMLSYGLASGTWAGIADDAATARGVVLVKPAPTQDELRTYTVDALAEASAGRLRPVIGQRFPLERAADAHAAIQGRATVGKTLLEVR